MGFAGMTDPFGNVVSGANPQSEPAPSVPSGGATSNPVVDQLVQQLAKAAQTQRRVAFPQQLPPNYVHPGDVSGNFVNPSTAGGPAHNAKVSLAQAIGGVAAQAINRHEEKESRDLAYQINRVESLYNTLNDPNATEQEKKMATQELNEVDKATWKKIQKATGIPMIGTEDKRTNVEKQAIGMAKQTSEQAKQQTQQVQQGGSVAAQQGANGGKPMMNESLGVPGGLNPQVAQLMHHLTTTTGLTPEAQARAQQIKDGVIPSAGELLKYVSEKEYYKVLEDKMGVENATKILDIQRKAEADVNKLNYEMSKLTDQKEIAEKKLEMQQIISAAHISMQGLRIDLMRDDLDRKREKDRDDKDLKTQKVQLDSLQKTSKALNDQVTTLEKAKAVAQKSAGGGFLGIQSDKQKKAAADVAQIDAKLANIQQRQQQVNQRLESINQDNSTTSVTSPELDDTYKKLTDKYLNKQSN